MKFIELNTTAISGVIRRFGVVVYILILLVSIPIAYESNSGSYQTLSSQLLMTGALVVLTLVILEIVRRTLLFIFLGEVFIHTKIPLTGKVIGIIGVVLVILAGVVFLIYDKPKQIAEQKKLEAEQKQRDADELTGYNNALTNLPLAQAKMTECLKAQKERIASLPPVESAQCRNDQLGYNSCRENGSSVASCLYIYDYQSSCKPDLIPFDPISYSVCNNEVREIKNVIFSYQIKHHEIKK